MNYEAFKNSLQSHPISIQVDELSSARRKTLDNEALFQLPFIAMAILVMVKGVSKPSVTELGRLMGECLEQSMPAFKTSNQYVAWSANLRVRTVTAVSFLEMAELIEVANRNGKIKISKLGKKIITKALSDDSDLSNNLENISRQFRNITKNKKIGMSLF